MKYNRCCSSSRVHLKLVHVAVEPFWLCWFIEAKCDIEWDNYTKLFFKWDELKDLKFYIHKITITIYVNIVHNSVYILDSEHFSFAELIHPTSQVFHIKMLIRQYDHCKGVP